MNEPQPTKETDRKARQNRRPRADDRLLALIGRHIREARKNANLRQRDLAAAVGMSVQHLSDVERGVEAIAAHRVFQLASALGLSIAELFPDPVEKKLPSRGRV